MGADTLELDRLKAGADASRLGVLYEELGAALLHAAHDAVTRGRQSEADARCEEAAQAFKRAVREGGPSLSRGLGLANARAGQRRWDEALRAYLDVVRVHPAAAAEVLDLAHACLTPALAHSIGTWLDLEWSNAVIENASDAEDRAAIARFLGRVNLYRGNFPAAVQHYRTAQRSYPQDPYVLEGLGESLRRTGDVASAAPILEDAVYHADRTRRYSRAVSCRRRLAMAYLDLRRYQESIGVARQALSLVNGRDADLWSILARARLGCRRVEGAIAAAKKGIELDGTATEPHAALAAALLEQGLHEEAVKAAEDALKQDPRHTRAICVEGRALIEGHIDVDQGIRLARQYLDRFPSDVQHRMFYANAMRSANRPATEIVEVLQAGLSVPDAPRPPALYLQLAEALNEAGDAASSLAVLDHPTASGPRDARWWRIRGDALRVVGDSAEALEAYDEALDRDPRDVVALRNVAALLDSEQRFEESTQAWQRAVDVTPYDGTLQVRLALAARSAGDLERAWAAVTSPMDLYGEDRTNALRIRAELADTVPISPEERIEAFYDLGVHLSFTDAKEQASQLLGRVLELDPGFRAARWYRLECLRQLSATPAFPYWNREALDAVRQEWSRTVESGTPTEEAAWTYVSGALMADADSRHYPAERQAALIWQSVAYTERSLLLDTDNVYAWAHLSGFHRRLGNYANAFAAAERALEIDPENLAALDERVGALADRGMVKEARELIDKRLEKEPSSWAEGVQAFLLFLENKVHAAVEHLNRVVGSDPGDMWSLALRSTCFRLLALTEKESETYQAQARSDSQEVLSRRGNAAYVGQEPLFASAAYGLGQIDLAIEILKPLLESTLDPTGDNERLMGCCYLRRGDVDKAKEHLNRGIDTATTLPSLKEFDALLLREIERDLAQRTEIPAIRNVLIEVRSRISSACQRLEQPPRPTAELERFVDSKKARVESEGWSQVGAGASLARLALEPDGEASGLETAELIYHRLARDQNRFPEAALGLAKVKAAYRQGAEEALRGAWRDRDLALDAVKLLRRAIRVDAPESSDAELLVLLALALFQADMEKEGLSNLATGALRLEEPAERIATLCQESLPDVTRYWELDAHFRRLARDEKTPESLRSVLARAVELLTSYLDVHLGLTEESEELFSAVMTPIVLAIGGSMIPKEAIEERRETLENLISEMRERIEDDTGVPVLDVQVRLDEDALPPDTFVILFDEIPIAAGHIPPSARYSSSKRDRLTGAGVKITVADQATNPLSSRPGWWISQQDWERVEQAKGCTLWAEPLQFAIAHLEAALRANLERFVGMHQVEQLVNRWRVMTEGRELVSSALPDAQRRERFARVLRALVWEGAQITAWETILTAANDAGLESDEIRETVQRVRPAIKSDLPGNRPETRLLATSKAIERTVKSWVSTVHNRTFLAVPPEEARQLLKQVRDLIEANDPPVVFVVEDPDVRDPLQRLIETEFRSVRVQVLNEILTPSERQASLRWRPLVAEWGEMWPQTIEPMYAS